MERQAVLGEKPKQKIPKSKIHNHKGEKGPGLSKLQCLVFLRFFHLFSVSTFCVFVFSYNSFLFPLLYVTLRLSLTLHDFHPVARLLISVAMAIWPFGRKSKRHTIQVTGAEAIDLQASLAPEPAPTLGRRPSKRQHRSSREDIQRNSALASSKRPTPSLDRPASLADHPQHPPSRTGSLLRRKPSQQHGPNKLRRKLSKRKANEIMREREIRMLSSTPIDIPHRQAPGNGDYALDHRRRKGERRADRYMSDISLSIRDSAASSASDMSDPYTYKVNAFAALTPRPVVRYVEAPRLHTAKSNRPASTRQDKERLAALTRSEEDLYYSRRRVNELADSLDAGALRELLDRDRRRREKKQIDDQEKLRRKLQERADAQQAREEQAQIPQEHEPKPAQPEPSIVDTEPSITEPEPSVPCLLYTSDAADEMD